MTTRATTAGPSLWEEIVVRIQAEAQARAAAEAKNLEAARLLRLRAFKKTIIRWLTDQETTYWSVDQLDGELRTLGVEVWEDGPRATYRGATFSPVPNHENTRDLSVRLPCPTCRQVVGAGGESLSCLCQAVERHLATCCAGA